MVGVTSKVGCDAGGIQGHGPVIGLCGDRSSTDYDDIGDIGRSQSTVPGQRGRRSIGIPDECRGDRRVTGHGNGFCTGIADRLRSDEGVDAAEGEAFGVDARFSKTGTVASIECCHRSCQCHGCGFEHRLVVTETHREPLSLVGEGSSKSAVVDLGDMDVSAEGCVTVIRIVCGDGIRYRVGVCRPRDVDDFHRS